MKNNRNKKIYPVLIISISLIVLVVLLSSYALWRISKTQSDSNLIYGACLSIDLQEIEKGLELKDAWPTSDENGSSLTGYSFNVINNCQKKVAYQIVLDSIDVPNEGNEINSNYIKIQLDNNPIAKYGLLEDGPTDGITDPVLASKLIYTGEISEAPENGTKTITHNLKIWISEDAPNDEIGKEFKSKVRIVAGQGIVVPNQSPEIINHGQIENAEVTPENCFEFDSTTGTITGYNEDECTTEFLVVPETINGTIVKNIGFQTYKNRNINWQSIDLTNATGLEVISDWVFLGYAGENEELIIPNNVKTIGTSAFVIFHGTNLQLGTNLITIGPSAFEQYQGVGKNLIIPDSVKIIDNAAFESFNGQTINLGSGLESVGELAFCDYAGDGEELVIPNSLKTIGYYAFGGFNGDSLVLGSGLESIDSDAFSSYEKSISVNMSSSDFYSKFSDYSTWAPNITGLFFIN